MIRHYRHLVPALTCLLLSAGVAMADTGIFKRELPDGTVIYSDEPHPDATRITPPPPQVIPPFRAGPPDRPQPGTGSAESAPGYERLAITTPADDEVIWNHEGIIEIGVEIAPDLRSQAGHRLVILLDGVVVVEASSGNRFAVEEVFRGTHVITASIEDGNGNTLVSANPVTFHLRQHSILSPTRPQPPR